MNCSIIDHCVTLKRRYTNPEAEVNKSFIVCNAWCWAVTLDNLSIPLLQKHVHSEPESDWSHKIPILVNLSLQLFFRQESASIHIRYPFESPQVILSNFYSISITGRSMWKARTPINFQFWVLNFLSFPQLSQFFSTFSVFPQFSLDPPVSISLNVIFLRLF